MNGQDDKQEQIQRDIQPAVPSVVIHIHALMRKNPLQRGIKGRPDPYVDPLISSFRRKSLQINNQPHRTDEKGKSGIDNRMVQPFCRHSPECPKRVIIIKIIVRHVHDNKKKHRRILLLPLFPVDKFISK